MWFLLPLTEGIRNSKGKGVQEEEISKGVGLDSQGLFSRTLKQEYIIDDLTLTLLGNASKYRHRVTPMPIN